jgi:hypothetical protein
MAENFFLAFASMTYTDVSLVKSTTLSHPSQPGFRVQNPIVKGMCDNAPVTPVMLPSLTLGVLFCFALVRTAAHGTPRVSEGSAKRVFGFSHRLSRARLGMPLIPQRSHTEPRPSGSGGCQGSTLTISTQQATRTQEQS